MSDSYRGWKMASNKINVMLFTIWYHLHKLKNIKNTHGKDIKVAGSVINLLEDH